MPKPKAKRPKRKRPPDRLCMHRRVARVKPARATTQARAGRRHGSRSPQGLLRLHMLPTHSAGNARGLYASEASSCVMANTIQQKYLPPPRDVRSRSRCVVSCVFWTVFRLFRISIQPTLPVPHTSRALRFKIWTTKNPQHFLLLVFVFHPACAVDCVRCPFVEASRFHSVKYAIRDCVDWFRLCGCKAAEE
jgi:hypothetical protein